MPARSRKRLCQLCAVGSTVYRIGIREDCPELRATQGLRLRQCRVKACPLKRGKAGNCKLQVVLKSTVIPYRSCMPACHQEPAASCTMPQSLNIPQISHKLVLSEIHEA